MLLQFYDSRNLAVLQTNQICIVTLLIRHKWGGVGGGGGGGGRGLGWGARGGAVTGGRGGGDHTIYAIDTN